MREGAQPTGRASMHAKVWGTSSLRESRRRRRTSLKTLPWRTCVSKPMASSGGYATHLSSVQSSAVARALHSAQKIIYPTVCRRRAVMKIMQPLHDDQVQGALTQG